MYRSVLFMAATAIAATAVGSTDGDAVGVYRLRVSPEARSMARIAGKTAPEGCLKLAPDHTFSLSSSTSDAIVVRAGRYQVDGSNVILAFRSRGKLVAGSLQNGRVVVDGLIYERDDAPRLSRDYPVRSLGGVQNGAPSSVYSPDPNGPVTAAPASAPAPKLSLPADFSIVGEWTVHKCGAEIDSIRMCFDKDGTFRFKGMGAKSMGKYEVHDCCVTLKWTQVDDDTVELGSMKKDLPICADGCSFMVDVYRYERASKGQ